MIRLFLAGFLVLSQAPSSIPEILRATVASISQGMTPVDRRSAVVDRLKSLGVTYETQDFMSGTRAGENIVVTIPGRQGSSSLLIGAHLDRVERGQGALDNGASCAVLLELASRLKARPLENTTVTVVFFDLEEAGLLGSRDYLQRLEASKRPARAMNFDIFGYGDTFFVTPSASGTSLEMALRDAASGSGLPVRSFPMGLYPGSDHKSMAAAGIETLGVALIDGSEIDSIVGQGGAATPPRILTLIHTNSDTLAQIREQDMAKAIPVLEKTIRLLDAMASSAETSPRAR